MGKLINFNYLLELDLGISDTDVFGGLTISNTGFGFGSEVGFRSTAKMEMLTIVR